MIKRKLMNNRQLFFMLFVSYTVSLLTTVNSFSAKQDYKEILVLSPILLIAQLILPLPLLVVYAKNEKHNLIQSAEFGMGKVFAYIIAILYIIFFLYSPIVSIANYNKFVKSTMLPNASVIFLSIAVVITALYGAFKGVYSLARTSGIIGIGLIACLLLFFCTLVGKVEYNNFSPLFEIKQDDIFSSMRNQAIGYVSSILEIGTLAIIMPHAQSKKKIPPFRKIFVPYVFWSIGQVLTLCLIAFCVVGVLGNYANTQQYPFYTATTVASLGSLQRLDAFLSAVWTTGIYIKVSLFLVAISLCVSSITKESYSKIVLVVSALIVVVLSVLLSNNSELITIVTNETVTSILSIAYFFVIPLLVLIFMNIKK